MTPKAAKTNIASAVVCSPSDSLANAIMGDTCANRIIASNASSSTAVIVIRPPNAKSDGSQDLTITILTNIWHEMPPFTQLLATGTDSSAVYTIGRTF